MERSLSDKIELTIDNYRCAKEYLRNDGELVNHFTSLIYANYESNIPIDRIKKIRKYIKSTSNRMSPFRGEMLYILSILIARQQASEEEIVGKIYEAFEVLSQQGFIEGAHLALVAYVIVNYTTDREYGNIAKKMKDVYGILKERYNSITQEDDYLVCALWALNKVEVETISEFIEVVYNQFMELNIKSKNGVQGLSNAIILNESSGHMYRTMEFISQLERRNVKLSHQFLPLLGVLPDLKPRKYADMVEGVIDYLCEEESEYEFYMDKGFRTVIAIVIISFCVENYKTNYIDELLAHGTYLFLKSKQGGVLSEVLI